MKLLNKILYCLLVILSIILCKEAYKLGVIPNKYLFTLYAVILIVLVLIILGIIFFKKKGLRIMIFIIELLSIIVSIVGIIYIHGANNFFDRIKNYDGKTATYYVVVKKDSSYKELKDLEGKEIGLFQTNADAVEELSNQLKFKSNEISDVTKLIDKDSEVEAVYISSGYYNMISEFKKEFKDNTRILKKIKVSTKSEVNSNTTKDAYTILISGIDVNGDISTTSRSDVNILMTINLKTHEVLLTHIPRDYYVQLHNTTGLKDKLTHSGVYGIDMTSKTIEDFMNIKVDYFVRVNFTSLVKVVDALGGIDVESDIDFGEGKYHYTKGINHLNGEEALMFSRFRKMLSGGDRDRGNHQEAVISAIINKVTTSKSILTNYNEILNSVANSIETDLSEKDIKELVKYQLNGMYTWNVNKINVDGTGAYDYCYSWPSRKLYVMVPDQTTVDKASNYINNILKGKRFSEV